MIGNSSYIEENDFNIDTYPAYLKICSWASHLCYYVFVLFLVYIIVIPIFALYQQRGYKLTDKLGAVYLFFLSLLDQGLINFFCKCPDMKYF